MKALKYTLQML